MLSNNINKKPNLSLFNIAHGSNDNGKSVEVASSGIITARNVVRSLATLVAYSICGIITGVSVVYALRDPEEPLNISDQHVILCVVGFQFLMAQGILCLAPDSFLSSLSRRHKRWIHWILQIVGSVMALTGCFIVVVVKDENWNTPHGRYALVAIIFTLASVVNGLTSQYAYELRRFIPRIFSKLTHISFGVIALGAASVSLSYGFDYEVFRTWAWSPVTDALIILNSVVTIYITINPCITFITKLVSYFKS